jgi:hypothetical protein
MQFRLLVGNTLERNSMVRKSKKPVEVEVSDIVEVTGFYNLDEFIERLRELPETAHIEFEQKYYDNGPIIMKFWYKRPETEAEKELRLAKEKKYSELEKQRKAKMLVEEQKLYERLKAKYEKKVTE